VIYSRHWNAITGTTLPLLRFIPGELIFSGPFQRKARFKKGVDTHARSRAQQNATKIKEIAPRQRPPDEEALRPHPAELAKLPAARPWSSRGQSRKSGSSAQPSETGGRRSTLWNDRQ